MSRPNTTPGSSLTLKSLRKSVAAVFQCAPSRKTSKINNSNTKPVSDELRIHGSIPPDISRRRIALQACGLLEQSRKYGDPRLYDAREQDSECSNRSAAGAEEKGKEYVSKQALVTGPKEENLFSERNAVSLAPPYSSPPPYPTPSASSAARPSPEGKSEAHRIRRIASIVDEIDGIEDEESRRLTEVAYLC